MKGVANVVLLAGDGRMDSLGTGLKTAHIHLWTMTGSVLSMECIDVPQATAVISR